MFHLLNRNRDSAGVAGADYTIMCLTQKQGCYTGDGIKYSGKLYFSDLGIKNINKSN